MKRYFFFVPLSVAVVAYLGSIFTSEGMQWYRTLVRPAVAPPNGVFGPVWTTLFLLIIASILLFVRHRPRSVQFEDTLWLLVINGVLNVMWTVFFFRWHMMGWAILDAALLSFSALIISTLFWPFSKVSAVLLWPYVLWTAFATVLTYSFWLVN